MPSLLLLPSLTALFLAWLAVSIYLAGVADEGLPFNYEKVKEGAARGNRLTAGAARGVTSPQVGPEA